MDFGAYMSARESLAALGAVLTWTAAALAVAQLVSAVLAPCEDRPRSPWHRLPAVTLLVQAAGFVLLAWFHWRINRTVPLLAPGTDEVAARFALPLWIEGEKLYFWALWVGVFGLLIHRRQPAFRRPIDLAWGVFLLLALFATNPFHDPLPRFHEEVSAYRDVIVIADPAEEYRVFGMMYGRLMGYYNSAYMWIHPPVLFVAYAALLVAFLASLQLLAGRGGALQEGLSHGYTRLGYLLLTAGMLIGYPWTRQAWEGQSWWWDPKINVTLMMWVLYTAYLHSHLYRHRPGMGRLTHLLGVVSFLGLVFTYITTYLVPGVHSVR